MIGLAPASTFASLLAIMAIANSSAMTFSKRIRTVFLDRDGVLNQKMPEGHYVTSWKEFRPLPGVVDAVGRLNRAGLRVLVVSNQRGIALGLYSSDDVRGIHSTFQGLLETHGSRVDRFYFCPHEKLQCNCRKPLRGLFDQAIADFPDITPETSVMIGDSASDIEFGRRLGMSTMFIEADSQMKPGAETARAMADLCVSSLVEAVDVLLLRTPQANGSA